MLATTQGSASGPPSDETVPLPLPADASVSWRTLTRSWFGMAVSRRTIARAWFAVTALVVLVGLVLQLRVTATTTGGFYPTNPQRLFNVFAFFTVQSNVLVCLTSSWLAVRPETTSPLLRTLRLDALLGIAVTGVVFHLALRQLQDLQGGAAVADFLLHTASPVLCVLGWLVLGPRGAVDGRVIAWALLFPVAWLAGTLMRGDAVGFWPYPFLNADDLGWARALTNCALVAVLFTGLALVAAWADRLLPGLQATVSPGSTGARDLSSSGDLLGRRGKSSRG